MDRMLTQEQARWFDVIITADGAVRGKPDPEPLLLAAHALNIKPEKGIVIDNAPFGIEAARSAGCAVATICTTLSKEILGRANWQDTAEKMSSVSGDSR